MLYSGPMAETKPQETQQELFAGLVGEPKKPERFPSIQRSQKPILVTTSVEQIVLTGIVLILAGCFVFFLGVLRGKAIAVSGVAAEAPFPQAQQAARTASAAAPARTVPAAAAQAAVEAGWDAKKPYTIQLVTYKKKDLAEKEVAALRRSGYYSMIIPSGDYYQVCVGQYSGLEDAKKDLKLFGARYKGRFPRRR